MSIDVQSELIGEVCRKLAEAQAERWGYTTTLAEQELAAYVDKQAADPNVRADVEVIWRHAGQMAEELRREVKRAHALERMATRHARAADVEVAEADAKAARLQAEVAGLRAQLRRTELELHDAREVTG